MKKRIFLLLLCLALLLTGCAASRRTPKQTFRIYGLSGAPGGDDAVIWEHYGDIARALNELRDRGFMTVGLDSEGAQALGSVEMTEPLALVLGAEGKGLRQLTRETCHVVARLDLLTHMLEERYRRLGVNYAQSLLFMNFLPVQ